MKKKNSVKFHAEKNQVAEVGNSQPGSPVLNDAFLLGESPTFTGGSHAYWSSTSCQADGVVDDQLKLDQSDSLSQEWVT